jgi:purine-binding chemotaxis protein CheW
VAERESVSIERRRSIPMTVMNPPAPRAGKYLTFVLGAEQYGVEIIKVREILGVLPITPIPQAPHYVKGVINLRGKVIPVVDTRTKFGMSVRENTPETCIIVVDVGGTSTGLLVDTVKEVVDIDEEQIEDPPKFGSGVDTAFVHGLGKIGGQVRILLDIDRVVGDIETSGISL